MKYVSLLALVIVLAASLTLAPVAIIEHYCYAVGFRDICGGSAYLTLSESCERTILVWVWIPASIAGTDVDIWIPCVDATLLAPEAGR